MKICVFSFWHNEAALAPFFLHHYSFADEIRLVIGTDTMDATREIIAKYPNVNIMNETFPDGLLHDQMKIERYNEIIRTIDADWVIAVDADEFVFPSFDTTPREILATTPFNLFWVSMFNVYRNVTEKDLDPEHPSIDQRRFGDPVVHHTKPIIIKPETEIVWRVGNHSYFANPRVRETYHGFIAAHWAFADAEIAIARYIRGRRDRMSEHNKRMSHGYHTFDLTEKIIRDRCAHHANEKRLF